MIKEINVTTGEVVVREPTSEEQAANDAALLVEQSKIPQTIKAWQAKAAIEAQGHLPAVEAALAGMPEGVEKVVATSAWNNAADFDIDSPTVTSIATAIGLTDAEREALFVFGASLEV